VINTAIEIVSAALLSSIIAVVIGVVWFVIANAP
jgi:hypothetical protein